MIIQIVNSGNNQIIEEAQTRGMATNQFMEWLTKWSLQDQTQLILLRAQSVGANTPYKVSCKLTMSLPQ